MKRIILKFFPILLLVALSCTKAQGPNPVPYVYVNLQFNTDEPLYTNLNTPGEPVYINNVGNKGIVVIQDYSGNFWAFDRTCPYQINSTCGKIIISNSHQNFLCGSYSGNGKNFDACCNSEWNLDGSIAASPTTYSLKAYHISVTPPPEPYVVTITN